MSDTILINCMKGGAHNGFFFSTDGKLYGFGDNSYNQLNIPNSTIVATPTELSIYNEVIVDVFINPFYDRQCFYLTKEGNVYVMGGLNEVTFGFNQSILTTPRKINIANVKSIYFHPYKDEYSSSNRYNSYVFKLANGDEMFAGYSATKYLYDTPVLIVDENRNDICSTFNWDYPEHTPFNSSLDVKEITNYKDDSFIALSVNGSVYVYGSNHYNIFGYYQNCRNITEPVLTPWRRIMKIYQSAPIYALYLTDQGVLYYAGILDIVPADIPYSDSEILNNSYFTSPIVLAKDVIDFAGSRGAIYVAFKDGSIKTYGINDAGQCASPDRSLIPKIYNIDKFSYDLTSHMENMLLPNKIKETYTSHGITHTIIIQYDIITFTTIKMSSYIHTPSLNKLQKIYEDCVKVFDMSNKLYTSSIFQPIAEQRIREIKEYIDNNTIYHHKYITGKRTVVKFNDGTYVDFKGELSREDATRKAKDYLKNKYTSPDPVVYLENDISNNLIEGDPMWDPNKHSVEDTLVEEISVDFEPT